MGSPARASQATNAASETGPDADGRQDLTVGPAATVAVGDAPDDAHEAGARQPDPDQIQAAARRVALAEAELGQDDGDDADGHVHPEDPVPRNALGDRAADDRADRDGQAGDATPGAQGERSALSEMPFERIVRLSGVMIAPPIPCAARARMSAVLEGARAAAADPRVKTTRPSANIRRRPKRSPSAAPSRRSAANVRV